MSYNPLPHFSGGMLQLIDEVKQQKKAYNELEATVQKLGRAIASVKHDHIDLKDIVRDLIRTLKTIDLNGTTAQQQDREEIRKLKEAYAALLVLQSTDETWKLLSQAQERHGKPVKLRQGAFDSFHGESKSE